LTAQTHKPWWSGEHHFRRQESPET